MQVSFRQLNADDSIDYRDVRAKCLQNFPDNFGSTFEEESQISELKFERYLHENNPNNFMFGAFSGMELIGICGFIREDRNKTKHRGEIVQMYVNPEFAGQNIGYDLLKATIDKAFEVVEIEQIILSVVAENKSANKLYERVGFAEYGILRNYLKQDEIYWNQRFMCLERNNYQLK
jgi:RimJ/RimL family protein N-acetyltransferase